MSINRVPKELKALYYNFRGVFHTNIKEWTKALEYHRLYNYFVQSGESPSYSYPYQRAASTANLGEMFLKMNNTDSARYWLQQASDWYRQSIEQGMEIPTIGYFIDGLSAMLALQENRVNDAGKLLAKQALYDSTAVNPFMIYEHHKLLEEFHAWKGDYRDAYNYRLKVEAYNDSLRSTQIRNNIAETEMRYRQDTILLRKDLHIAVAEGRASRWESIALLGGLLALLLAVFGIYAYHSYRQKRSINAELEIKNREITEQRDHIVRQNREITNSILYARRIQNAVLPERQMLKDDIDMFIFYRPRNIVSGDFYWMSKHENRLVIIAADCTGHGVPGAFMSMLGIAFLNEIVGRHHTIYANEILNRLRENVITSLGQTGKSIEIESKDGMDIAVCIIDIASMTLQYAGAYNPLVLIRNGELQVIKADKMPVAYSDHGQQTFTNNHISLVAGDAVYIFSDGYADQFGGEHEKKYSSRRLKKSLLEVHQLPVSEQEQIMAQKYDEWKGAHEQVDDVLLMGMRV